MRQAEVGDALSQAAKIVEVKYGRRSPFPASAENLKKLKAVKTALHLKVSVKKSEP